MSSTDLVIVSELGKRLLCRFFPITEIVISKLNKRILHRFSPIRCTESVGCHGPSFPVQTTANVS